MQMVNSYYKFQHTAARRRLLAKKAKAKKMDEVSTHSRPKAAACAYRGYPQTIFSFNTQPPEGGCGNFFTYLFYRSCFNTQPPEGGCETAAWTVSKMRCFNTQPPEGGCFLYKKMIKISKLFTVFRYPLKYKEYQEV